MLNEQKKHIDKEQGNIKHEVPRSVNYRATQNKNNIGTTTKLNLTLAILGKSDLDRKTDYIDNDSLLVTSNSTHKQFLYV